MQFDMQNTFIKLNQIIIMCPFNILQIEIPGKPAYTTVFRI